MPENPASLLKDSRWPAFFPASISLVTTADKKILAIEKEVGATIVNRFPYILALSICTEKISETHYERKTFCRILEESRCASIQFLDPGKKLDQILNSINTIPENEGHARVLTAGLPTRPSLTNSAPVFEDAYMIYEARLVEPETDYLGNAIFTQAWTAVGSHKIYFLEINSIQLRQDIAHGRAQINWHSLPDWDIAPLDTRRNEHIQKKKLAEKYTKGFNPNYYFPAANTVAFEYDKVENGMAVMNLKPTAAGQMEEDNDRSRWPCFFPSTPLIITSYSSDGTPNIMPCGSTSVLSRKPFMIFPAIAASPINERYAPRYSIENIRRNGYFGCGVPFDNPQIVHAIHYLGNISYAEDADKVAHTGLSIINRPRAPMLTELPIHFECKVIGEQFLGTHILFFGEVVSILIHPKLSPDHPIKWVPTARTLFSDIPRKPISNP